MRPFEEPGVALLPLGGWDAATPLFNGWAGVDLFFVLSGFLITGHIASRRARGEDDLRTYLSRRALRIVPAYFTVLFVVALGLVPFYSFPTADLGSRVAYHALFLQDYLPADIVVTFWSLGVEEKFYLLAPIVLTAVAAVPARRARYALLGALILVPFALRVATHVANPDVARYEEFFYVFRSPFHVVMDGLLVGMLCAFIYRERAEHAWTRDGRIVAALFWGGALLIGVLLTGVHHMGRITLFDRTLLFTLLAIGFGAVLLALALGAGAVARPFRAWWLFILARLSYSLYLVHLVLMPGILVMLERWPAWSSLAPGVRFAVFLPPYLALSLAASLVLHWVVEKPFLELKDRIGTRRERRPAVDPIEARVMPGSSIG